MIQVSPVRARLAVGMVCALLVMGWAMPTPAQVVRGLTFRQMVEQSDVIFTATVSQKKCEVVNGRIYTRYTLKSPDFWKGQVALSSAGDFQMVEGGGHLDGPVPIGQFVPGTSQMAEGENVLLFCGKPAAQSQVSLASGRPADPRATSLFVKGAGQGRFTVFQHPETGQKLVARPTLNAVPGAPMNPRLQQAMIAQSVVHAAITTATAAATTAKPAAKAAVKAATKAGGAQKMAADQASREASSQALKSVAEQMAEARKVGATINAQAAKAKAARASLAAANPAAADEVYQYESMDDVRARVQQIMANTTNK